MKQDYEFKRSDCKSVHTLEKEIRQLKKDQKISPKTTSIELYGDGIGKVEYIDHMGNDLTAVNAARVSFGVNKPEMDESDVKLLNYLVEAGHVGVLEHCAVTFRFTEPLFIARQHMRSRTISINEASGRYSESNFGFYLPKEFRTQHKSNRQSSNQEELINPIIDDWEFVQREKMFDVTPHEGDKVSDAVQQHAEMSFGLYKKLLESGVCREQARGVLPQSMYTQFYGTANLRNTLHFVDLRIDSHAQWEIQVVAQAVLEILKELYPEIIKAYFKHKGWHWS